ncbi:MAG: biopolymer transporter ExbD [Epsilonproteobacteria bacterium]|nr:biopolymer transporter ExbD [Campylobacterota bacterium]
MNLKRFDQINVIPLIDIMLVMLVMVLTTATFIAKGSLKIDLPSAQSAKELPLKKIEVSISKEGEFFLDSKKVTLSQLERELNSISKESFILIQSDKAAPFEFFVKLLDLLKEKNFNQIAIKTVKE